MPPSADDDRPKPSTPHPVPESTEQRHLERLRWPSYWVRSSPVTGYDFTVLKPTNQRAPHRPLPIRLSDRSEWQRQRGQCVG